MRVLIISPDRDIEAFLRRELPADFDLTWQAPGAGVVAAARRERPQIAVLDRIDTRRGAAVLEAAILREAQPDVRIIAVSGRPSAEDAVLVAEGVFFYLPASPAIRLPEIIAAAARAIDGAETERLTRRELA